MNEKYQNFSHKITFRRQVVFENDSGIVFCAVDFGNFRDDDKEWVDRLNEEIKAKIDKFLAGNCSDCELQSERAMANLVKHNFECHKITLSEYQEITASEAEQEWGLAEGTVRAALGRDIIQGRKSSGTWLVTRGEMKSHYGQPRI